MIEKASSKDEFLDILTSLELGISYKDILFSDKKAKEALSLLNKVYTYAEMNEFYPLKNKFLRDGYLF